MNKRTVINIVLVVIACTMLLVVAFNIRPKARPDCVAILKSSGMTCGNCSKSITQTLERLRGVTSVEVAVEAGMVAVAYNSKTVAPGQLASQVTRSGFSSTVMQVMTPEEFVKIAGRMPGDQGSSAGGCGGSCGKKK